MQFSVLQFHLGDEIYCSFVCTHLQRHLVIQQLKWRNIFLRFLFLIGVEAKNKQLTKSNRRNSYCWISALPPKPSFFFFLFFFLQDFHLLPYFAHGLFGGGTGGRVCAFINLITLFLLRGGKCPRMLHHTPHWRSTVLFT